MSNIQVNIDPNFHWYKLVNVKGLGANGLLILYRALVKESISVMDIFGLKKVEFYSIFKEFGKGRYSRLRFENFHNLEEEKLYEVYEKLHAKHISLIPVQDKNFPVSIKKRLKVDSPPILYLKGNKALLDTSSIAIVGARNADESKLALTRKIAAGLAEKGYNIVSGYAKGVDTNAHLGAFEGKGTTTVVMPQGMNYLSIKTEFKQYDWQPNTLFLSQFLPFEKWRGSNAMKRNKIVTALSDAVVVISAGPERDSKGRMSGTFDAGKSALEMKMPVFVLSPSLFTDPPIGNVDLISRGAIEFKSSDDILSKLSTIDRDEFGLTRFEKKPTQLNVPVN